MRRFEDVYARSGTNSASALDHFDCSERTLLSVITDWLQSRPATSSVNQRRRGGGVRRIKGRRTRGTGINKQSTHRSSVLSMLAKALLVSAKALFFEMACPFGDR